MTTIELGEEERGSRPLTMQQEKLILKDQTGLL